MIIKNLLQLAQEQLSKRVINSSNSHLNLNLESLVLLSYVLDCSKTYLWAYPEKAVSPKQEKIFLNLIARRVKGEPIAYIIGSKEFWSLELKVTPDTLIPRSETELLIEIILKKYASQQLPNFNVLDLGTGSGAICLALASEQPNWHITAVDFSREALEVARYNAEKNNINNINFIESNWFENIKPDQKFDLIVSNPPYIEEQDSHLNQGDLRFEPKSALVSGIDGLDDVRNIIINARNFLSPHGLLILEHGYNQAEKIRKIFLDSDYQNIEIHKDLAGLDRVSCAVLF